MYRIPLTIVPFVLAALLGKVSSTSIEEQQSRLRKQTKNDDARVSIELYYEAQCPGCRQTITEIFKSAFDKEKEFVQMADVTFVPYGNAKETKNNKDTSYPYTYECQHGPSECIYNLIEACAIDAIDFCPILQFQYINCIENHDEDRTVQQNYNEVVIQCANDIHLAEKSTLQILSCFLGTKGNELEHQLAIKTDALSPPHEYVPWIVINGKHFEMPNDESFSLFDHVCELYTGPNKSSQCPSLSLISGQA